MKTARHGCIYGGSSSSSGRWPARAVGFERGSSWLETAIVSNSSLPLKSNQVGYQSRHHAQSKSKKPSRSKQAGKPTLAQLLTSPFHSSFPFLPARSLMIGPHRRSCSPRPRCPVSRLQCHHHSAQLAKSLTMLCFDLIDASLTHTQGSSKGIEVTLVERDLCARKTLAGNC